MTVDIDVLHRTGLAAEATAYRCIGELLAIGKDSGATAAAERVRRRGDRPQRVRTPTFHIGQDPFNETPNTRHAEMRSRLMF